MYAGKNKGTWRAVILTLTSWPFFIPHPHACTQNVLNSLTYGESGVISASAPRLVQFASHAAMSLPEYGPHLPASPSQWRQQRNSLVPSGFECVAHPVFFRISELSTQSSAAPTAASATAERRRLDATSTPTTTISQTAAAAWDVEALGKGGSLGASDLRGAAGGIRGGAQGGEREVDAVCPICLGKFERPVTLTSCLHSFCHTWCVRR